MLPGPMVEPPRRRARFSRWSTDRRVTPAPPSRAATAATAYKVETATDDEILHSRAVNDDVFLAQRIHDVMRIKVRVEEGVDEAGKLIVGRVHEAGVHRAVEEQPGQANAARAVERGKLASHV